MCKLFGNYFSLFFIPVSARDLRRYSFHEQNQFRPLHASEPRALTQEDARVETTLFKPFVVDRIAPVLPVKDFHHPAGPAHKYIDIAVGRVKADQPYLPTQTVDTHAHIGRMLRHDDAVVLIQIKHSVFDCKVRNPRRYVQAGLFRTDTLHRQLYEMKIIL